MAKQPVAGTEVLSVPRQGKRGPREARLEIRFARVKLTPPSRKLEFKELHITTILAQEVDCPQGVEPLQWMLLTTMAVENFDAAVEKVGWYAKRWGIEVFHRTLKSGCKIEERQLGSANRIETCLAIDMVVAWRIFHLTKLGRETPDVACSVFFEEAEWKALYCFVRQDPKPPDHPPTLREAIRLVATFRCKNRFSNFADYRTFYETIGVPSAQSIVGSVGVAVPFFSHVAFSCGVV